MNVDKDRAAQPVGQPVENWAPPKRPTRESLAGRYCRVAPLVPSEHAAQLFESQAVDRDQRNWTYLPYGPFPDYDAYLEWMNATCLGSDPFFYAIVDQLTDRAVGLASYLRIDPGNGSIEVGHIHFSPLLQRTAAATEAMYLLMKRAFELGYRRYEWKCDALNAGSRRAAQRLGLTFEGIFRQATIYKGRNRDTAWYAAIDREWPALEHAFSKWLDPANFDAAGHQQTRLSELTGQALQNARER